MTKTRASGEVGARLIDRAVQKRIRRAAKPGASKYAKSNPPTR